MGAYRVYILRCADGSYYTGSTSDLPLRVAQHQAGSYAGYTATRLPVTLVYSQEFSDPNEAVSAERRIKGWSRAKKEALIAGDWERLQRLSRGHGRDEQGAQTVMSLDRLGMT